MHVMYYKWIKSKAELLLSTSMNPEGNTELKCTAPFIYTCITMLHITYGYTHIRK